MLSCYIYLNLSSQLLLLALPSLYFDLSGCGVGGILRDDQLLSPPGYQATVKKASWYRIERLEGLAGGKREKKPLANSQGTT